MIHRITEFIQSNHMIQKGDVVCVGLSGGADSVCLLVLLDSVKEELGIELRAFHVNHHLRDTESDEDELFVRELCKNRDIDLAVYHHSVRDIANEMNCGTEETGRFLRKQDADLCIQNGCTKIALAHHKNDQAETILFNLSRGSSVSGFAGIRPVSGAFIHPMLCFDREEILAFLEKEQIPFRTDSSNEDTRYTRNFIRHRILPLLTDNVNKQAVAHLCAAAEDMSHVVRIIDKITDLALERYTVYSEDRIRLKKELAEEEDGFIVREVIAKCILWLSGKSQDISRKNLDLVQELFRSRTGVSVSLPFDLTAVSDYGDVILEKKTEAKYYEVPFEPGKIIKISDTVITSEFIQDPSEIIREKNKYTKCFDYDKIGDSCVIRTRRPGDLIVIDENGHTKKLKDYFIDIKMSRQNRDSVLLLATGNIIHWVIGYRMGASARVTEQTTRCIKISTEEAM